MSNFLK